MEKRFFDFGIYFSFKLSICELMGSNFNVLDQTSVVTYEKCHEKNSHSLEVGTIYYFKMFN